MVTQKGTGTCVLLEGWSETWRASLRPGLLRKQKSLADQASQVPQAREKLLTWRRSSSLRFRGALGLLSAESR
jgi:hypothetical protein